MKKKSSMMILGCGNMAQALVRGLFDQKMPFDFFTYTPSKTKAQELAKNVEGECVETLKGLPKCDYYMIACKPQQLEELVISLENQIPKDAVIISILAGVTTNTLKSLFFNDNIVRIMPNTPSLVGHGVNAFYFTEELETEKKDIVLNAFSSFSEVFTFDKEEKIDVITGFSGSGPAYIFEFSRIMINKMMAMGVSEETASAMVKHTFLGASKLMVESEDNPETLRNKVTSKKGVTYEALEVFKEANIEKIFDHALDAAYTRSVELSKAGEK